MRFESRQIIDLSLKYEKFKLKDDPDLIAEEFPPEDRSHFMVLYLANNDETQFDWIEQNRYITDFVKRKNYEKYMAYIQEKYSEAKQKS